MIVFLLVEYNHDGGFVDRDKRSTNTFEDLYKVARNVPNKRYSFREIDNKSCERLAMVPRVIGEVRSPVQGSSS